MAATTDAIFIIQWTTHHKRTVQIRHLRNDWGNDPIAIARNRQKLPIIVADACQIN